MTKQNPTAPKTPKPPHQNNSVVKKSRVGLFTVLLILITIINISYLGFVSQQLQKHEQQQLENWQGIMQQAHHQFDTAAQKIDTLQNTLGSQQKSMQQEIDSLQQQLHAFINDTTHAEQAWVIQKAIYYLQMAQISNRWDNDPQAAARWLSETSLLLKSRHTEVFDTILQKIEAMQSKLSATPSQNTGAVLQKIADLQSMMDTLYAETTDTAILKPETSSCDASSKKYLDSAWQEYKNNVYCLFQKFIIIHRPNDKDMELLSPIYQRTMHEKISLEIAQVQWAFLQNNPRLYKQTLQQIRKDIAQKFNENNPHTQKILDVIQQLQSVSRDSMQINFSPLINELQQMIDNKDPSKVSPSQSGG